MALKRVAVIGPVRELGHRSERINHKSSILDDGCFLRVATDHKYRKFVNQPSEQTSLALDQLKRPGLSSSLAYAVDGR